MPGQSELGPVEITSLAAGGAGVARVDGRVFFVRDALPGDITHIEVLKDRGRFVEARATHRVQDSPQRVVPPCGIQARCGGCPWMGLGYDAQLRAKEGVVRENLSRLGGITDPQLQPITASPLSLGYRRRARLHGGPEGLGYYSSGSRTLLDVESCPVLENSLQELWSTLRNWYHGRLRAPLLVEMDVGDQGVPLVALSGVDVARLGAPPLPGVQVLTDTHPLEETHRRRLPFSQANRLANDLLTQKVTRWLDPSPGRSYLDVYCGSGNLSWPLLAAGARVVGVEADEGAISRARALTPPGVDASWWVSDVGQFLNQNKKYRWSGVVINPPRTGAAPVIPSLLKLDTPRLVYVSCDPATLARDLKGLLPTYRLAATWPFDLMPHTDHVEVVCWLERG